MFEQLHKWSQHFDPEQWREHGHRDMFDPLESPEPQTYREMLPDLVKIIKHEPSYQDDPFLQAVPDQVLPLMWALRSSENVGMQLVNE